MRSCQQHSIWVLTVDRKFQQCSPGRSAISVFGNMGAVSVYAVCCAVFVVTVVLTLPDCGPKVFAWSPCLVLAVQLNWSDLQGLELTLRWVGDLPGSRFDRRKCSLQQFQTIFHRVVRFVSTGARWCVQVCTDRMCRDQTSFGSFIFASQLC